MDTNEIINQLREENEQLKLRLKNQDVMITANLGVRGQIKKAAFELGYHGSMEADEIDYLIKTARASVMVNQKNVELQAQLVAVQDSVVHGKCANSEPCSTFCEAIATRKMFKQLQVGRDALAAQVRQFKLIFRSENLSQNETAIALQKMASSVDMLPEQFLAAHDAEVAKAAFIAAYNEDRFIVLTPDNIETRARQYAEKIKAGAL